MCFGGGTEAVETTSTVQNKIPQWVEDAGKEQFETALPIGEREFPGYDPALRVQGFSPTTQAAQNLAVANVGNWTAPFESAYFSAGQGGQAVNAGDVSNYMNPFTQQVIDPIVKGFDQQLGRNLVEMRGQMSTRGSYLNEDRRQLLETNERTRMEEAKMRAIAPIQYQAFTDALGQGNTNRNRMLQSSQIFSGLAPQAQALGQGDVSSLATAGAQVDLQGQTLRDISYEEFLRSFNYPQEQMNWLQGFLSGTPYSTEQNRTGTELVAQPNQFSQILGAGLGVAGLAMSSIYYKTDFRPVAEVLPEMKETTDG